MEGALVDRAVLEKRAMYWVALAVFVAAAACCAGQLTARRQLISIQLRSRRGEGYREKKINPGTSILDTKIATWAENEATADEDAANIE